MSEPGQTQAAPVAVVGGGIAGAAACLRLTARGLAPVWIAPHPVADDKPGEQLAPAAQPLLAELGVPDLMDRPGHRPAHSLVSAWGSPVLAERAGIVHLEGPGTVLDRAAFERDLCAAAEGSGVLRLNAVVRSARRTRTGWRLDTDAGAVDARFAIDASGRAAVVGRGEARRFRADRLAALVAFPPQDPESAVAPTPTTLIETGPEGWWYASLLADGRLALNLYSDPDLLPLGITRDVLAWRAAIGRTRHVARWIDEAGFRVAAPPRLASAGTVWLAPAAGADWAAAGDAAAAFDPLSSHGMTTALWTGIKAADATAAALGGDAGAPAAYADRVARGVHDVLVARTRVYAAERRFPDSAFWRRRAHVPAVAAP